MSNQVRSVLLYSSVLVWSALSLVVLSGCGRNEVLSAAPSAATVAPSTAAISVASTASAATMPVTVNTVVAPQKSTPAPSPPATPTVRPTASVSLAGLLPTPTAEATVLPTYAPTPDGVTRQIRVPILMYHYLGTPPADADIYRRDLSVPPERFAAHLDRMLTEGYTTVSLYQVIDALQRNAPLPDKPVVITFDDGYRDNYENAFPLLKERALQATIFVVTDFMDEERPAYLTWDMAREMATAGISIESHGRNHIGLAGKDD
ncbi:MAG: polysaccharide deacetylase family protein, partial [Caldilinea sp.]